MKQVLYIFLCLAFLAGCKKAIQKTKEQVAEELIVTAMTDGSGPLRYTLTELITSPILTLTNFNLKQTERLMLLMVDL